MWDQDQSADADPDEEVWPGEIEPGDLTPAQQESLKFLQVLGIELKEGPLPPESGLARLLAAPNRAAAREVMRQLVEEAEAEPDGDDGFEGEVWPWGLWTV